MLTVLMGIALAFNVLIIRYELTHDRIGVAILDGGTLIALATVFGGSTQSLATATIASMIISIVLLFSAEDTVQEEL